LRKIDITTNTEPLTSMQPSNAGLGGKTNWLWLLNWEPKSNIESAKTRTGVACETLAN
jgi:hypothetical protein